MIPQSKEVQEYLEGIIIGESELVYGKKYIALKVGEKIAILQFGANGIAFIVRVITNLWDQLKNCLNREEE